MGTKKLAARKTGGNRRRIIDSYLYDNLTQMRLLHSTPKKEKTPGLIGVQLRPGRLNKLKALI